VGRPDPPTSSSACHGLARNSRDFDFLADELTPECRVMCMDVAGRGESDWLENKNEYTFATYQRDAAAMLARTGATAVDWVGTSMGGLIGMFPRGASPTRRSAAWC
jgi:pimeloyl-ACP methyl ester carboxylesterase